ncbi:MAG TPA: hypothetical protein VGG99_02265 [Acetobacteraceae bacterium]|jgi:hypothetical protein
MKARIRGLVSIVPMALALTLLASPGNANALIQVRMVQSGAFGANIPGAWEPFSTSEITQLRDQFTQQSAEIYRRYAGSEDPTSTFGILAYHIEGASGTFIMATLDVPAQSNYVSELRDQASAKADWGIKNGYIQKYLGLTPIATDKFSGFYVTMVGNDGTVQISGGIQPKVAKSTMIELTLLCPQGWDASKAASVLSAIISSVTLAQKANPQ